jgi:hypothetical protein
VVQGGLGRAGVQRGIRISDMQAAAVERIPREPLRHPPRMAQVVAVSPLASPASPLCTQRAVLAEMPPCLDPRQAAIPVVVVAVAGTRQLMADTTAVLEPVGSS